MAKINLTDIASLTNEQSFISTYNANNAAIETASDTFLSRTGTAPNSMDADLDMDSHRIINLPEAVEDTEPIRRGDFLDLIEGLETGANFAEEAEQSANEAAASAAAAASSASSASTSASNASTSASNAATSASNASTSATTASSAATAASSAATAAANSATVVVGDKYIFDNSTSMADPGSGEFRFNNATPSSATAIAISANSAASGNPDISDWIAAWDDSSNTTARGTLLIRKIGTPATWVKLIITAVTDNTSWLQLTVSGGAGNGTFSNADEVSIQFSRTGDKGQDGSPGAGSGDVVGPASSVDSSMVEFSGTSGKIIKDGGVVVTSFAKTVLDDTSASTARTTLGVAYGLQTVGAAAGSLFPATTNGCAALAQAETTTNKINYKFLAFDASTIEYA
jgi:hypothetical protein